MGLGHEYFEVLTGSVLRMDIVIVSDVVPVILAR